MKFSGGVLRRSPPALSPGLGDMMVLAPLLPLWVSPFPTENTLFSHPRAGEDGWGLAPWSAETTTGKQRSWKAIPENASLHWEGWCWLRRARVFPERGRVVTVRIIASMW